MTTLNVAHPSLLGVCVGLLLVAVVAHIRAADRAVDDEHDDDDGDHKVDLLVGLVAVAGVANLAPRDEKKHLPAFARRAQRRKGC